MFRRSRICFRSAGIVSRRVFHQHAKNMQSFSGYKEEQRNKSFWSASVLASVIAAVSASSYLYYAKEDTSANEDNNDEEEIKAGMWEENLPEYSLDEVAQHNKPGDSVWVYYKHGVYDITEFVESHPGGEKRIQLAAGASIEPFWKIYAQHHSQQVYEILESYRIGNLKKEDYKEVKHNVLDDNPFADEPERCPLLVVNKNAPFNAETPLILLCGEFITPTPLFYVRNHLPVPLIDPETYELEIKLAVGSDSDKKKYSLSDLQEFEQHTVVAALQCAGNRRKELHDVENVRGLTWTGGAIGNATWTGVKLSDVLRDAGYEATEETLGQHCIFRGLDGDGAGTFYEASVPMKKVMDQYGDVLLAFKMNGEEISRDHGYPVRVIVPGHVGARNVKWLSKITVSNEESDSHWQRKDYKSFSPAVKDSIDWESAPSIQEMPVQSLICCPASGSVLSSEVDEIEVTGYAWSGGGRDVIRVDVRVGEDTWYEAELEKPLDVTSQRAWSWCLWRATIPIPTDADGDIQISCRAVDESYNIQPEAAKNVWNVRGLNNNAMHSIILTKE